MKYFIILINQNSKMNIQILTLETWRLNITVQAVISINLTEKHNNLKIKQSLKGNARGWRDVSAIKSVSCSSKGPKFGPQHPYWATNSQLSVIQAPGELTQEPELRCINPSVDTHKP